MFCGFRGLCKKEKAPLIFSNNLSESTTGKYIYRMIYEKLFADPKNRKKIHCFCAMQWTASYTKELNFRFYFYRNRKPCELLQRLPYVVSREKYDNANSEAKTKSMMRDFKLIVSSKKCCLQLAHCEICFKLFLMSI